MSELKTNVGLVKAILEEDKMSRNSDSFLYLKVIEHLDRENGTQVRNLPVWLFLRNMNDLAVPGFETISRTRQKVQAENIDLRPSEKVAGFRRELEGEFKAFAIGGANENI